MDSIRTLVAGLALAAVAGCATLPEPPRFDAIVRSDGPAVVNIRVTGTPAGGEAPGQGHGQDFPFPEPLYGLGSGFIVSPDGIVLTSAHVVEGADTVVVRLANREQYEARIVGTDEATDVAVLKIDARNLPTVRLGRSSSVHVGDWVLAIGSPYGFDNTATAGIVSGTSRALPEGTYVPFIQTDTAVNPGNSGGPLFNLKGEVIGIASQIYSETGGYQGLAFAVPIDVVLKVERELLKTGRVERGRIGVRIQELTPALARAFGLRAPLGALVSSIDPGGPAARAGMAPGDVITAVNGERVETSADLPAMVAELRPGEIARVELWRRGAPAVLDVEVEALPPRRPAPSASGASAQGRSLGLEVRPLTGTERRRADVREGLLVTGASGRAAEAGLEQGDIILSADGVPVSEPAELRRLLGGKAEVALRVKRGESVVFVAVAPG